MENFTLEVAVFTKKESTTEQVIPVDEEDFKDF